MFSQLLKFPMMAFISGMEMLVMGMQTFQRIADQTINTAVEAGQRPDAASGNQGAMLGTAPDNTLASSETLIPQLPHKESTNMPDQDLGGDDLKYVSYSILFTKRDYEATLQQQLQELVDYPTNGGSFGGLKIAQFFGAVARGQVRRPPEWVENNYPPGEEGEFFTEIPTDDERYVQFLYQVESRLPKAEADYQKRQADALEQISRKIAPN